MLRSRSFVLALSALLFACADKGPLADLDYGVEDAAKADSATRPSSLVPIVLDRVARTSLTATERFRGFRFSGRAGQRFDVFADGLGDLDTILYIYKISAITGRAYGASLARNDDTPKASWTLLSNAKPNALSSSARVTLPTTGAYAVVVGTYGQQGVGDAEVRVRPSTTRCDASAAARHFAFPSGVAAEGEVGLELATEAEAERYADPAGRTVRWVVKEGEDGAAQHWVSGFNDLWAVRFDVDLATCATKVTGEH